MRHRVRWAQRGTAVAAIAVAVLGVSGCGSEDKHPFQEEVERQEEASDAAWLKNRETFCWKLDDAQACKEADELRRGEEAPIPAGQKTPSLRRHERELRELEARCRREPDNPELVC